MDSTEHNEIPRKGAGRPIGAEGIRSKAARHAQDALEALAQIARDAAAPTADRVRAAESLLAHATERKAT